MTGGDRLSLTAIVAVVVCCSASALVGAGLVATAGALLRNGMLIGAGLAIVAWLGLRARKRLTGQTDDQDHRASGRREV